MNAGETVRFKINTHSNNYRIRIYRMGWYGGLGARRVAEIMPSVPLPQNQPNPIVDAATGLVDCGNWAVSASWAVPANAVSGVYTANIQRLDHPGENRILFVVRNDGRAADVLLQTSDTTMHAYNRWGGASLYWAENGGRAHKVSYNRPFQINGNGNAFWDAEYPLVRWLERNGYDVSYTTDVDSDRRGGELLNKKVFISSGHDEYWSAAQRANVEAARDAGVNLVFMAGNEVFWKVRWENSVDGTNTPRRTLVCYKETLEGAKLDPTPRVDRHLARRPLQPAVRRRPARAAAHRADLRRHQRRVRARPHDQGPVAVQGAAVLAPHRRGVAARRVDHLAHPGHARLRVGRRPRRRSQARRACSS